MLLRRLLAVLVAVGLVLAAALIRERLFSGDTGTATAEQVRVVCVEELASVCDTLRTQDSVDAIEDAATTVERFALPDPGVDVWITFDPWPELAAAARARQGLPELDSMSSDVLARSPVLLAARADRLAALEPACPGGELTWRCIGDRAGAPWEDIGGQAAWGDVKVSFNRPAVTAEGLLTLAQVTSGYFDGSFTSRSLEAPDYFAWLSDLAGEVGGTGGQAPLERMLLTGGADVEFTGVLEGTALPLLRSAPQRGEQIELRALDPGVTADVRVIGYGEAGQRAVADVAERLTAPLADAGWRTADGPAPSELEDAAVPDDNGLPSSAALEGLRQTWIEVARG